MFTANSAIKQLKQLIELNLIGLNYVSLGYIFPPLGYIFNSYTIKQGFYLPKCVHGLFKIHAVDDKS